MICYIYTARVSANMADKFNRLMRRLFANWQPVQDEDHLFDEIEDKWTYGDHKTFQFVVSCYQASFMTSILCDFITLYDCPIFFHDRSEDPEGERLRPWLWTPDKNRDENKKPLTRRKAFWAIVKFGFMLRKNHLVYSVKKHFADARMKRSLAKHAKDHVLNDECPF